MKEYKVLSQQDKLLSGRFSPETLEGALNSLAKEGWRVISMASSSREGLMQVANREELIILLERDVRPDHVSVTVTPEERERRRARLAEADKAIRDEG